MQLRRRTFVENMLRAVVTRNSLNVMFRDGLGVTTKKTLEKKQFCYFKCCTYINVKKSFITSSSKTLNEFQF